jgi:hypothetical protein
MRREIAGGVRTLPSKVGAQLITINSHRGRAHSQSTERERGMEALMCVGVCVCVCVGFGVFFPHATHHDLLFLY